jgi:hypothetical protein
MTYPKVEIILSTDGNYFSFSYRQDGLGILKFSVSFDNETRDIKVFYPR